MSLVHALKQDRYFYLQTCYRQGHTHRSNSDELSYFLLSTDFHDKNPRFVINFYVLRIFPLQFGWIFMVKSVGSYTEITEPSTHQNPSNPSRRAMIWRGREFPSMQFSVVGMMVRMLAPAKWNRKSTNRPKMIPENSTVMDIYFFSGGRKRTVGVWTLTEAFCIVENS